MVAILATGGAAAGLGAATKATLRAATRGTAGLGAATRRAGATVATATLRTRVRVATIIGGAAVATGLAITLGVIRRTVAVAVGAATVIVLVSVIVVVVRLVVISILTGVVIITGIAVVAGLISGYSTCRRRVTTIIVSGATIATRRAVATVRGARIRLSAVTRVRLIVVTFSGDYLTVLHARLSFSGTVRISERTTARGHTLVDGSLIGHTSATALQGRTYSGYVTVVVAVTITVATAAVIVLTHHVPDVVPDKHAGSTITTVGITATSAVINIDVSTTIIIRRATSRRSRRGSTRRHGRGSARSCRLRHGRRRGRRS